MSIGVGLEEETARSIHRMIQPWWSLNIYHYLLRRLDLYRQESSTDHVVLYRVALKKTGRDGIGATVRKRILLFLRDGQRAAA